MSGKRFSIRPGGALEGTLFSGFLRHLTEIRELKPGKRLGPWRIIRELGRGGSGVVYLAERADGAFAQEVALKWLRGDRPAFGGRQALERERELLAGLDHPNIARLIDGGQTDDGMLWFAMDYVPGERIDEHARGLTLRERIELIRVLCQAAHYAHSRGLIHGDIKPANVIVGDRGEPRLLDFGIARLQGADGGGYGLTPDFASPEQRDGGALTTASDIWQLGRLLEALLRGQAVPKDINLIVEKATAEDPGERYSSVAALESDLLAWQQQRPVMARGGGAGYRLTSYFRRYRALSSLTVAAFLIIAGGGGWFAWRLAQERDLARMETQRAEAALEASQNALARAEALQEFLLSLFQATRPDRPRDELPDTEEILASGVERALNPRSAPPADRFGMLSAIGQVYMTRGRYEEAGRLFDAAIEITRKDSSLPRADLARALELRARLEISSGGALEDAEALLQEAESQIADTEIGDALIRIRITGSWIERHRGNHARALELVEPLHARADPAVISPSTRAGLLDSLAGLYHANGDLPAAAEFRVLATEAFEQYLGPESQAYVVSLANGASLDRSLARFDRAERDSRAAIRLYDRIYDGPADYRAAARRTLADILFATGRIELAFSELERSSEEWARALGYEPEQFPFLFSSRGSYRARLGRLGEAAEDLLRAQELVSQQDGFDELHVAVIGMLSAWVLCGNGEAERGAEMLQELDLRRGAILRANPRNHAQYLEARAACLFHSGQADAALEWIERALDTHDPPGAVLARTGRRILLARVLAAQGRHDEAIASLDLAERYFQELGISGHAQLELVETARRDTMRRIP